MLFNTAKIPKLNGPTPQEVGGDASVLAGAAGLTGELSPAAAAVAREGSTGAKAAHDDHHHHDNIPPHHLGSKSNIVDT